MSKYIKNYNKYKLTNHQLKEIFFQSFMFFKRNTPKSQEPHNTANEKISKMHSS